MTVTQQTLNEPGQLFCQASLNYIAANAMSDEDMRPTTVNIHNGRLAQTPGWQECGFELKTHASAIQNWDDDVEIAQVHYREMAELAQTLTGCDHALVSGHIKRNPEQAAIHADLGPIAFVHSDFAASYGDLMRKYYQGPSEEAVNGLKLACIKPDVVSNARRLLILQFWRNVGPEKMDLPLAFCDARSVPDADIMAFPVQNYADGGFDFETLGIIAPDSPTKHAWYVFPDMRQDEVVAFRTFDSERVQQGQPFWTPHSAFEDPEVPAGQPSRYSIELRALCLFL